MATLSDYVDFLATSFRRKMSPRVSAEERLVRLVDEEFPNFPADERLAMVNMVLIQFADEIVVTRSVSNHSMVTRSKSRSS